VWGDQWPVSLTKLHVNVLLPAAATKQERNAGDLRIWGHPASVSGSGAIAGDDTFTLDAQNVPGGQFVEIDSVFPTRLVPHAANRQATNGLATVVDREKKIFSSPYGPGQAAQAPDSGGGGGGGIGGTILAFILFPLILIARLFGFGGRSGTSGGVGGFGGSFGGGGGGGGGAW